MYVIVGLGNPGAKYAMNRHNIGFMAVDVIANQQDFAPFKQKFSAEVSEGQLGTHKVILCKPMTYMNLSGRSVLELSRFYKVPLNQIYVFHDDLDLLPGAIKVKLGGGSGGHNGLTSIDQALGKEYWRIRLGIGHPGHRDAVSSYVLGNFRREDEEWLASLLGVIGEEIPSLLGHDPGKWLTRVHLKLKAV
jgi:peptidyl-tRNA hydrolase, PTH1 family